MATEPFPEIDPSLLPDHHVDSYSNGAKLQRRRQSSSLRGDPRGDTGAPALSTAYNQSSILSETKSSRSPVLSKSERPTRQSKRKRVKSLFRRWKSFSLRHTWFNPLMVCLTVLAIYLIHPSPSNPAYPALFPSYPIPARKGAQPSEPIQYGKGKNDFIFVIFYTVFLSFTREFVMQRLLRPLALSYGITTRGKQFRFMEQSYAAIYHGTLGMLGMYVMSRSNLWYFNTEAMYEGFPHLTNDGLFKVYYLLQASYWAQQMIVLLLLLEKPRKDFKELVAHHVITLSLIWLSYRFHFTKMGLPVFITHDISDFFLATSKVFNYIDAPIVVPYFLFFAANWSYLRHYQNLRILRSILPLTSPLPDSVHAHLSHAYTLLTKALQPLINGISLVSPATGTALTRFLHDKWGLSQFASIGPFTLDWAAQQYKCSLSQWISFLLLAALQAVNVFWLFLIFRVMWRIARTMGDEKVDERSEVDSEEEEERAEELERLKREEAKEKMNGLVGANGKANGKVGGINGSVKK